MRVAAKAICVSAFVLVAAAGILAPTLARSTQAAPTLQLRDGAAGFVVSHIGLALAPGDGGAARCPAGYTSGYTSVGEIFSPALDSPAGQLPPTLENALPQVFASSTPNLCQNPELATPDHRWRSVTGTRVNADGIDLDGQASRANGRAAPGTCAHADFPGLNGEPGIDNQLFRVVGCTRAFHSDERFNGSDAEMLTGSWGILITLSGVDDIRNDSNVEVSLMANADPIQLSAARDPLRNATYAAQSDPRFRATARGRIVNGVLTTDPVDFRFHHVVNAMQLERPLDGARLRLTFTADGKMEGLLAGYTPIDAIYDAVFAFRDGRDAAGNLSPSRAYSSVGAAIVHNLTCQGAYQALQRYADGGRDPNTGRCTSISTQYRIEAVPAFVVEAETHSLNDDLVH